VDTAKPCNGNGEQECKEKYCFEVFRTICIIHCSEKWERIMADSRKNARILVVIVIKGRMKVF
jgi:hypothetical protein